MKFGTSYVLPAGANYSINGSVGWIDVATNKSVAGEEAVAGKNYKFSIILKPNNGYAFEAIPDMTATINDKDAVISLHGAGFVNRKVEYEFTAEYPDVVNDLSLDSLVIAPVNGATPDTTGIDETQYTGTIAWFESDGTTAVTGNFAASKVYIAKMVLTAKPGYTLTGVTENSFTYTGATSVANAVDSGEVTITFAATAVDPDVVVDALDLTMLVTAPVNAATPDTTGIDETQYTGTIAWFESDGSTPVSGNFAASKVYVAKVSLTAKPAIH